VRDEGDKWKQLYEKEHTVASSLQQQLNVEVERWVGGGNAQMLSAVCGCGEDLCKAVW